MKARTVPSSDLTILTLLRLGPFPKALGPEKVWNACGDSSCLNFVCFSILRGEGPRIPFARPDRLLRSCKVSLYLAMEVPWGGSHEKFLLNFSRKALYLLMEVPLDAEREKVTTPSEFGEKDPGK